MIRGIFLDARALGTGESGGGVLIRVGGDRFTLCDSYIVGKAQDKIFSGAVRISGESRGAVLDRNVFDNTYISVHVKGGADVRISNNSFLRFRNGVFLDTATRVTVSGNTFESIAGEGHVNGYDPVLTDNVTDVDISANRMLAAREHGIYIAGYGRKGSRSSRLKIT